MDKKKVPVLVLHPYDLKIRSYASIEFYAFNEDMLCPLFEVDCPPPPKLAIEGEQDYVINDSYRARPFTGLNSFPVGCGFASLGTDIYVTGGTKFSNHHIERFLWSTSVSDVVEIAKEKSPCLSPSSPLVDANALYRSNSNRAKRFQLPKFISSLFENNERVEFKFGDLDDVSNDLSTYWETCPSLSEGRMQHQLLPLRGKLYAVGGNSKDSMDKSSSPIEVFDHDVWTPLLIDHPPDIDPYFLVSAAVEESNAILVGSKDCFYVIHVTDGKGVATCEKKVMCPYELLRGCSGRPGCAVGNQCVMWYDTTRASITGFHLPTNRYFSVDLKDKVMDPVNSNNRGSAKLTSVGDGILCLIYTRPENYTSIDEHGMRHLLREYRCVTFEIDFQDFLQNRRRRKAFPGLQLEPTVLSRKKCYAPSVTQVRVAFTVDVNFPDQSIRIPKKGRYFDVAGGSQVSDTNVGVAPTPKPPPPSKKSKRKSRAHIISN